MAEEKVTRNSCVVALGGGVVGDLAGFVASTYHRGLDIIQVPTTLLAQVDSSIGGKCGINLESGKNLVGSFLQPKVIVADTSSIETLNEQDFLSGLGEVSKYALLGNQEVESYIRDSSEKILKRDPEVLVPLIRSCMGHKVRIVAQDPHEHNGIRATLNLGHTLAHAIESATKYSIAHGVAVSLGLRYIAQLSLDLGYIDSEQNDNVNELLDKLGLESEVPQECRDSEQLIEYMYSDKKSVGNLSFVLMFKDGTSKLVHDVDRDVVKSAVDTFLSGR